MQKSHLGIYGLIEENEAILLIKKSRGPYIGMFDLPGGRPEHGESIFETLKREILEETGIVVIEATPYKNAAFSVDYLEKDIPISLHHIALIYKVTSYEKSGLKDIHHEDAAGSIWIHKSELKNHPISKVVQCIY